MQDFSGGICKTWCSLTDKFDGGGKLINVVQFQGDNWRNLQFQGGNMTEGVNWLTLCNFKGIIDETYNFGG